MTIRISQFKSKVTGESTFKVEGVLTTSSIGLLEQAYKTLRTQNAGKIILDVGDLTFVDFESASVIRRMKKAGEVVLRGCRLFTGEIIENSGIDANDSGVG